MCSQQIGECLTFRVAQFGKLRCDMRNGAMMLADLDAVADDACGGSKPGGREGVGDSFGGLLDIGRTTTACRLHVGDDGVDALSCERLDRGVTADDAQLPHCGTRQIVVGMPEPASADGGELKVLGRATSSATTKCCRRGYARLPVVDQCVEVTSNTGCAETEPCSDVRCGDRALFEQQRDHCSSCLAVVGVGPCVTCDSPRLPQGVCTHMTLNVGIDVPARGTG